MMLMIVLICILHFSNATDEYCNICKNGTHTLCKYKKGPAKTCIDYKTVNLTEDLKQYIVNIHNDIRNHVASGQETKGSLGRQPSAADMNLLEWDDELAAMAQRWADQCIPINESMQHDVCKRSNRFEVGQNVLTAVMDNQDFPELAALILHWYKQVGNVIPSDIDHFSGIKRGQFMIGQYTQLVWAKTRYVGCGISIFLDIQTSTAKKKLYSHRLICNYGPTGNVIGHTVYQKGIPCSKCAWGQCDVFRTSLCLNKGVQQIISRSWCISSDSTSIIHHLTKIHCIADLRKNSQSDKRIINQSCFPMIQEGNSTEVIYLLPRDLPSNVHITMKNNKKHLAFSQIAVKKHTRVRLKRSVNVTESSQEHQSTRMNVVDSLHTTKSNENNGHVSDINPKMLGMSEEVKMVDKRRSLVLE